MLIFDVLHKEKVYQSVVNDLRVLGVKHRLKKSSVKIEKTERNRGTNLPRKIFKVSLSHQPLEVVSLESGAIVHVPVFVSRATSLLEKCLNQEGLFRKAGSHARQKELVARLDNGGTLGEKNHSIDIANCLKTFFRDLPEPLIPFAYHDLLVRCLMLRDRRVEAVLLGCILLPPHHLNTLAFFMEFLKRVSLYEHENKMSIDNLAKVVGPNVMPLQETTMSAVQSRLEAHLVIVKILIENAEKIGVVPENISEMIAAEAMGSAETELDRSDASSRARSKKKKHRSGSLTRMFNGLRKMVGKSGSPIETNQMNNQLIPAEIDPLHTPSIKIGKKRKVPENMAPISVKKKRNILDTMTERTSHHRTNILLATPVSSNPNPVRERSPVHKSKVRKYLTNKVHTEIRVFDRVDKSKRLRMSLDRLVSRSKQKIADAEMIGENSRKQSYSPCIERRWSSASSSSAAKKTRELKDENSVSQESPVIRKTPKLGNVNDDYDRIFMEADVNLSDDCTDSVFQIETNPMENDGRLTKRSRPSSCRRSLDVALLSTTAAGDGSTDYNSTKDSNVRSPSRRFSSNKFPKKSLSHATLENNAQQNTREEYVRVPKSEYDEITKRLSAIESRISQEFGSIATETDTTMKNSAINVQTEYEKTLGEASIESTMNADHLAKRLSKELKIRRSSEHKIIRSPSARKIGILRRRSQEKLPSKRVSRTASWHISHRAETEKNSKPTNQLNNGYSSAKRGSSGLPDYYNDSGLRSDSVCSDETNARLSYLQEQLHTLITHTAEHTRGSFSDDEICTGDNDVFEAPANKLPPRVGRASSFHGNEFIDNSQYFNNRVKELKKTNSQQNVARINSERIDVGGISSETVRQKPISWKDAGGYFKMENRSNVNTPVPLTGRASIAKLRTQNAGMVLAKAKLFDERKNFDETVITKKQTTHERNDDETPKILRMRETKNSENDVNSPRKNAVARRKHCRSPKNNNARLRLASEPNYSSVIKMELTIVPPHNSQRPTTEKRPSRRTSHKYDLENREMYRNNNARIMKDDAYGERGCSVGYQKEKMGQSPSMSTFAINTNLQESNVNFYDPDVNSTCKTPHIKRPLAVKTPKSARTLARRPVVDTRRTPLKAIPTLGTPKRQSPRIVAKSRHLGKPIN